MNKSSWDCYIIGMLIVAGSFTVGYFARGSEVENNAKLEQLTAMQTSLAEIAFAAEAERKKDVQKAYWNGYSDGLSAYYKINP